MEDFEIYEVGNKNKKEEKTTFKTDFFDWLEILVTAIILLVVLFTFFFKVVTIDGPSMEDTLHNGERIIISNLGEITCNDIVVVSRNQNNIVGDTDASAPIIKRVIATAGQTVDIDFQTGVVYVDGVALDEPYTKTPTNNHFDIQFPVNVPDNCVFVLGDNRNNSTDSRSSLIGDAGMIDRRYILGEVVLRILPFDKFGRVE